MDDLTVFFTLLGITSVKAVSKTLVKLTPDGSSASVPFSKAIYWTLRYQGGNSQNFLSKFVRFFVTLGLKILRLLRQKIVFKYDIIIL